MSAETHDGSKQVLVVERPEPRTIEALRTPDSTSMTVMQPARSVDPLLSAVTAFAQMRELATALVKSGFMPKAINTAEKAIAVMLTGREMGIGPMQSVRSINIVDGKPVVAADLQLARFKADGGRATFKQLSDAGAVLWLKHPNGDEHTEEFSIDDAKRAGLAGKDNWKHHPRAMLRSRVITAGLKSVGYEPVSGAYDPDEAAEFTPMHATATVDVGAESPAVFADATAHDDGSDYVHVGESGVVSGRRKGAIWLGSGATCSSEPYKGVPWNARYAADAMKQTAKGGTVACGGKPVIADDYLLRIDTWAREQLAKATTDENQAAIDHFSLMLDDIRLEGESRAPAARAES